jgi:ATP-dependent Clp protease protease subunit
MMDAETWFNAKKAVELGFADRILYEEGTNEDVPSNTRFLFDKITVTNALLSKLPHKESKQIEDGTPHEQLMKRLNLLKY